MSIASANQAPAPDITFHHHRELHERKQQLQAVK